MARRAGFSLIEAAIVLGIVGLVIGGIWVAAAAVQDNLRLSKAAGQLTAMRSNIQRLYYKRDTSDATPAVLRAAGVFPADMLSGSDISLPWADSKITSGCSAGSSLPWYPSESITLCLNVTGVMSPKTCIALHRAMAQAGVAGVMDMGDDGQSPFGWPSSAVAFDFIESICARSSPYSYSIFMNFPNR